MSWLEDLFFFNLQKNISAFNILFQIPEDVLLSSFTERKVSKTFYRKLCMEYQELFSKYLSNIDTDELKEIINSFRNIINPKIETGYQLSHLFELFRYYLSLQFNIYFKYHKHYYVLESQNSESLSKIKSNIEDLISQKSLLAFKTFKDIIEDKYLNTKISQPLFIDGIVKYNLITESGGSLTYTQLPEALKRRMKNVLSRAEHDFIIAFFQTPKMQDLIKTGKMNLAPNFKEKMIKILESSLEDLQELNEQVLVKKLESLFKPNSVKEEDIKFLANNVQCSTIDGRLLLSQVAELLSSMKNHDLNNLLQTIFEKSKLEDGDLPHFDLTAKEGIFALAMEAISSSSNQSKNIVVNVYGKQNT